MGIMGDMAEAPDTFDAEVFKEQAAFLAKDSASPWSHFENQKATGNATEAVWSDVNGFRTKADNFQKATTELNTVAQTATSMDQVLPAFGQVGESCKSCHTDFKVKKD
jgi:cytochrome c556